MKIGILGASGAVGRQMIACLEESPLEIEELRLFVSENSAGKKLSFKGEEIETRCADSNSFDDLDYVLGAVSDALSKKYYALIKKTKAVYIDNSAAFRLLEDVPLVVPEINGEDALDNHGLIANPNCSTIIALMALAPIHRLSKIRNVYAATYQAVSGAGNKGIEELKRQAVLYT